MSFFKHKQKTEEILPPPPPFSPLEFDESEEDTSEYAKGELIDDLDGALGIAEKQAKWKKAKIKIKDKKTGKKLGNSDELEDLKIELPKEIEDDLKKEIDITDSMENFGIDEKPKELEEAREEIYNAIEKIKGMGKAYFFNRFFGKGKKTEEKEEPVLEEIKIDDGLSSIKSRIDKAREALMKLDLKNAKKIYAQIMETYNRMKPEEQAQVYEDIKDLYLERKSAEQLKA